MVVEVDADENEGLHLVPGGQRYLYPRPGPRHCRKAEQRVFPFCLLYWLLIPFFSPNRSSLLDHVPQPIRST